MIGSNIDHTAFRVERLATNRAALMLVSVTNSEAFLQREALYLLVLVLAKYKLACTGGGARDP